LRAGPLSDGKVIELLNKYYVPVYVSNEDYDGKTPTAPGDEVKVYQRIYREALEQKRAAGSVCVYLVAPDGKGFDSVIVSDAAKKGVLEKHLRDGIEKLKTAEGKPLAEPAKQSIPPKVDEGSLVLYLVSRVDHRGSWGEFPSENWIVLTAEEQANWLPKEMKVGAMRTIDKAAASKVLTHFYPQTETCDCEHDAVDDGKHHHIEQVSLKTTVIAVDGDKVRVRLEGDVNLKHTFYPRREDDNYATASVVGYAEVDAAKKKIVSLRLVTDEATYGKFKFAVAVRSEP
jgi:hypothetical protein